MKRASTRFWLCASALVFVVSPAIGQWPNKRFRIDDKYSSRPIRSNELTLSGLRPGKTTRARATALNKDLGQPRVDGNSISWYDLDSCETLHLDMDTKGVIQTIHVSVEFYNGVNTCSFVKAGMGWRTGHDLSLRAPCTSVNRLYGEPDSRSPSTKNGQPLELLYYAFDWAGPDVPQVMEVVCTAEKEGKPGQVVEITLAAGSL